jgi:hypothetical protein
MSQLLSSTSDKDNGISVLLMYTACSKCHIAKVSVSFNLKSILGNVWLVMVVHKIMTCHKSGLSIVKSTES